jgi:Interferon-induced transmembrane protein
MTEPPTTEMPQGAQEPPGPGMPPAPPPHNVGWAVAAVLFFWPLSFSAFSHAFNVYPLWASGNFAAAQYASDRARRLGVLSLWIFGGLMLLFTIFYAIFLIVLVAGGGMDWGDHGRYY